MNQGISQALSMLLYAIAAVGIFSVAIALFGGGYTYTESGGAKLETSAASETSPNHVNSVWEQFGATMKR